MRRFKITVNNQVYDVCVEEKKVSDNEENEKSKNDTVKEDSLAKNDK